jgi:outer membrane protein OmpA-like peptidoglycan-associated protein
MLNRHPELSVQIVGHTDNSGDAQDNLRLSAARAETVKAQLVTAQVDENRLEAVGLGGSEPVADSDTAEGRAKNRRIELVIRKGPLPAPAPVFN